jgi:hypothetical protein
MSDFFVLHSVVLLAVWSVVDIWTFSRLTRMPREFFERWMASKNSWIRFFGEGILCDYCCSHYVAAGLYLLLLLFPTVWSAHLTLTECLVMIPVVARVSVILRENVIPPLTGEVDVDEDSSQENETNG